MKPMTLFTHLIAADSATSLSPDSIIESSSLQLPYHYFCSDDNCSDVQCISPVVDPIEDARSRYPNADEKTLNFIVKAEKVHGVGKYDYSLTEYKKSKQKVEIVCHVIDSGGNKHGTFWQTPATHSSSKKGYGCKICGSYVTRPRTSRTNVNTIEHDRLIESIRKRYPTSDNKSLEFILKSEKVHGIGKYDYSLVKFTNSRSTVQIICIAGSDRHIFTQISGSHYATNRPTGCPICNRSASADSHKLSRILPNSPQLVESIKIRYSTHDQFTLNFILLAETVHGVGRYDYSESIYVNSKTAVSIRCNECTHQFTQIASNHIVNRISRPASGCPRCASNKRSQLKVKPLSEMIDIFNQVHGDKYDYSLITEKDYTTATSSLLPVICKIHGKFLITAFNHSNIRKKYGTAIGCRECTKEKASLKSRITLNEVLEKFKETHGDRYDYSMINESNFFGAHTKVPIICRIHGKFDMTPSNHYCSYKKGCALCGNYSRALTRKHNGYQCPWRLSTEEFIERSAIVHNGFYSYENTIYTTGSTKVEITCPIHGKFFQLASSHMKGHKCKDCAGSSISIIANKWLDAVDKLLGDRVLIREFNMPHAKNRPVDGYDPVTNTVYQFHGDYFHSNPAIYDHSQLHPLIKYTRGPEKGQFMTHKDVYDRTMRLDQDIRDHGYNLIIMWENEFKHILKEDRKQKKSK